MPTIAIWLYGTTAGLELLTVGEPPFSIPKDVSVPSDIVLDKGEIWVIRKSRFGNHEGFWVGVMRPAFEINYERGGSFYGAGAWLFDCRVDPSRLVKILSRLSDQIRETAQRNGRFHCRLTDADARSFFTSVDAKSLLETREDLRGPGLSPTSNNICFVADIRDVTNAVAWAQDDPTAAGFSSILLGLPYHYPNPTSRVTVFSNFSCLLMATITSFRQAYQAVQEQKAAENAKSAQEISRLKYELNNSKASEIADIRRFYEKEISDQKAAENARSAQEISRLKYELNNLMASEIANIRNFYEKEISKQNEANEKGRARGTVPHDPRYSNVPQYSEKIGASGESSRNLREQLEKVSQRQTAPADVRGRTEFQHDQKASTKTQLKNEKLGRNIFVQAIIFLVVGVCGISYIYLEHVLQPSADQTTIQQYKSQLSKPPSAPQSGMNGQAPLPAQGSDNNQKPKIQSTGAPPNPGEHGSNESNIKRAASIGGSSTDTYPSNTPKGPEDNLNMRVFQQLEKLKEDGHLKECPQFNVNEFCYLEAEKHLFDDPRRAQNVINTFRKNPMSSFFFQREIEEKSEAKPKNSSGKSNNILRDFMLISMPEADRKKHKVLSEYLKLNTISPTSLEEYERVLFEEPTRGSGAGKSRSTGVPK